MIENEQIVLGGNIELVGFQELDGGSMVILKKMVGNHVRKMNDLADKFEKLTVSMKRIGGETSKKFEIAAKVIDNGKPVNSEVTDFNLFFTMDKALSQIVTQMQK